MPMLSARRYGFQLYQSDPSGNYNGWKATCIGANNQSAMSLMKQEYKDEVIPLSAALQLAMKVLTKTCDATSLTADKFDLATLTKNALSSHPHHISIYLSQCSRTFWRPLHRPRHITTRKFANCLDPSRCIT